MKKICASRIFLVAFLCVLGQSACDSPEASKESAPVQSANAAQSEKSVRAGVDNDVRSYIPPTGSAAEVVARLQPMVASGDGEAAFLLYLKVDSCRRKVFQDENTSPRAGGSNYSAAEMRRLERLAEDLKECDGLTPSDYSSVGKWLELAAQKGVLTAQLAYAANPEAVLGGASQLLADPGAVIEYKRKALGFLHSAAQKGSVDALVRLGGAYTKGVLADRDVVKGYAYYYAARQANPVAVSKNFLGRFEGKMTAKQLSMGVTQGRSIYESCCG